jgi:cytochrome P450
MTATNPPGPRDGVFGLKNLADFQKDPLTFLTHAAEDYGDIINFPFGIYNMYILKHPDYIRDLLVNNAKHIQKWPKQRNVFAKVAGEGSFTAEGETWRRQRRLVSPAFHTQRIQHYVQLVVNHTQQMLERWGEKTELEMSQEMHTVTMGIIGEILFDIKDIETDAAELSQAISVVSEMTLVETTAVMPVPDWIPTSRNLKENHAMKVLDEFIRDIIQERRTSGEDRGDVLSSLLLAVDEEEDGGKFTDEEARDEVITLFIAGHETTATALTWSMILLAQNPDIQDRLYGEISSVLQGRAPTFADLQAMTYTDRVLKESMRVYPPAWCLIARAPLEEIQIGGYTLPKDSVILAAPWVMHHDARYFPDPLRFDPERFSPENEAKMVRYSYFPFGAGPRVCSGQHLAMMEAEVLLATIIQRYQLELLPGQTIIPEPFITIRPKYGARMKVTPRS